MLLGRGPRLHERWASWLPTAPCLFLSPPGWMRPDLATLAQLIAEWSNSKPMIAELQPEGCTGMGASVLQSGQRAEGQQRGRDGEAGAPQGKPVGLRAPTNVKLEGV